MKHFAYICGRIYDLITEIKSHCIFNASFKRIIMVKTITKILACVVVAVMAVTTANAQELVARKYGTVLEQLNQSSLYNRVEPEIAAIVDYESMFLSSCFWSDGLSNGKESDVNSGNEELIAALLDYAFAFEGTRYRMGGSTPKGFDCSGFTSYVFKKFGYELNRTSRQQINDGELVEQEALQPGDLVFFNGRAVNKNIGHVGIVTEVDSAGFSFIHASSKGVRVSKYPEERYYQVRYIGACRPIKE